MSKIEVDAIEPQSGTSLTLGASGDTITIPSGATLTNSGTATGFYSNTDALTLFNASGSAPVYACRAWVNFNGSGVVAISEDGNVSSITDVGTGSYTVNFTTAMEDVNYSFAGSATSGNTKVITNRGNTILSASSHGINCQIYTGAVSDSDLVLLSYFR